MKASNLFLLARLLADKFVGQMPLSADRLYQLADQHLGVTMAEGGYDRTDAYNALIPDAGELSAGRVRRLCDVDTGIGSDGLLEVTGRDGARAVVRIWNPDGSTAELSGNGTRIAAAWMLRESGLPEVEIETESKLVRAVAGPLDVVRQELGAVSVGDDEVLDVAGERLGIVPVDVGNPHAVVLRDTLEPHPDR